jgi:Fur family transcriptional regulator, ferric uptake regulator
LQIKDDDPGRMETTTPRSTFFDYLRGASLRVTPERFEVLETISDSSTHFDADELYIILKTKGSKVSRATVYNTLELLHDCGLVSKYRFHENHSRYEKAFDRPPHEHLICLKCGGITEFVSDRLTEIQDQVCRENDFEPKSSSLQVVGICASCRGLGESTENGAHT